MPQYESPPAGYGLALCTRCKHWLYPDMIVQHFEHVHGETHEIDTWPDGEIVVIDDTLEPEDFLE